MACAGCSTSPADSPATARRLPPAPGFAKQVHVKTPVEDDDALAVAGRERAGRAKANDIIMCFSDWYTRVTAAYAAGKVEPDRPEAKVCQSLEPLDSPEIRP